MNSQDILDRVILKQKIDKSAIFIANDYKDSLIDEFKNGKTRGTTTHFPQIDGMFTWKKTYVICWMGYGGHGKSEIFKQLALMKSKYDGWKWCIFPPENMSYHRKKITANDYIDGLAHTLLAKNPDPYWKQQPKLDEYVEMLDFISKHFIIVYPTETKKTVDTILRYYEHVIGEYGIDGCCIDPWNKLTHDFQGREDTYLANQFSIIKNFAVTHNQCFNIIAHPRGGARKKENGELKQPDQHDLAGGAMWDNAMDAILSIFKHKLHLKGEDSFWDTDCLLTSKKIKEHNLVGIPGEVELNFFRKEKRYFCENYNPLDDKIKNGGKQTSVKFTMPNTSVNWDLPEEEPKF